MLDVLAIRWDPRNPMQVGDKVANGICSIIKDKLLEIGYKGIWIARPVRLVGSNSDQFAYKSCVADYGTRETIHVLCRPGDKSTCWEVSILPPEDYDIRDIAAVMGGEPRAAVLGSEPRTQSTLKTKPTVQDALRKAMGDKKIFVVKVVARLPHGLQVITDDEFEIKGLIPIEHIEEPYNKTNLHKYSQGDTAKVCIVEASDRLVKFSITAALAATGSNKMSEIFTGKPNSDGLLPLPGFSKDISRRMLIIEWLRPLAIKYHPNPIPRNVAINTVANKLTTEYRAKAVERKGVAIIIGSLVSHNWLLVSEERDFSFTDLGWRTIGGRPEPQPTDQPKILERSKPEPPKTVEAEKASFSTYISELLDIEKRIVALQDRKSECLKWLSDNYTKETEQKWEIVLKERA